VTTVRTPIGVAVDAIPRVPVACWLGAGDDPNGFPNYPVLTDANGVEQQTLATATHATWDGAFGAITAALLEAISVDPTKVPADTTGLDRAGLLALYPEASAPAQVTP